MANLLPILTAAQSLQSCVAVMSSIMYTGPAGPWNPANGPLQRPEPMAAPQFEAALRHTLSILVQCAVRCVSGAVNMGSIPAALVR